MGTLNNHKKIGLTFINDASPILDEIYNNLITEDIVVLFRSKTIEEGLFYLQTAPASPEICLLDLDFYDSNIITQLWELRNNYPDIKIIIHSDIDTEETVRTLLSLGIDGYLLVGSSTDDFQNAIRAVSNDKKYFSMGVVAIARRCFDQKQP